MEPEELAAAAKGAVVGVGGGFMRSRYARAGSEELDLPGWRYYVAGRGGVLGDVHPDVVAAAMVFFPSTWIREQWEARGGVAPDVAAARYARSCQEWGRARLAGFDGAARLSALAERVAAAADPAGLPLFAGWRAMPLPDDPPGRLAQALHVLREHRGNLHAVAVLASGMTPLEAVIAGPEGAGNARFFGWPEPFPDPAPLAGPWQTAEATTDALAGRAYGVLDPAEREEFAALAGDCVTAAFPP